VTVATAPSIDRLLPHFDAETVQRELVLATPAATYAAIWDADLLSTPLARRLSALAVWPDRVVARVHHDPPPPPNARSARLHDLLGTRSPWRLLAEEPGVEVVLGLLWTPPAGGMTCEPEQFAAFTAPGVAKVLWSIEVMPFGAGHSVLVTRTRTHAVDVLARRRFALTWPLVAPFAALLRGQVLRAIKAQAESD
jgi:hypothetical protein